MNKISEQLASLGLTANEASLYLAALEIGETGMTNLAHRAGLKRTTAYVTFATLQEKGLMHSYTKKGKSRFVASSPSIIKNQLKDRLNTIDELTPQLEALTPQKHRPRVSYYEGKEGYLIAARESLSSPNTTIYHLGSLKQIHNVIGLGYDEEQYVPERIKNNIYLKALYPIDEIPKEWHKMDNKLRTIKPLPKESMTTASTLIWDDAVAYFSGEDELFTLIVHSADLAAAEKAKFDLIWNKK